MIFENATFYFFWKLVGIPSTRGSWECFLDQLKSGTYATINQDHLKDISLPDMYDYFINFTKQIALTPVSDPYGAVWRLMQTFSQEQEYWLVNRLDSDTSWLLYFAKDQEAYRTYREFQKQEKVVKHYLAKVAWNVSRILQNGSWWNSHIDVDDDTIIIHYPLMHHRHLDDRMVVIKEESDTEKWRGKLLTPSTSCRVVSYDIQNNETLLHITITKGVRHQIRSHLWWLWYPILGEVLYGKKDQELHKLRLWSIGMEIKN